MKYRFTLWMIPVVAALIWGSLTVMAQATQSVTRTVKLSIGKADTVTLPMPAADVLVANPAIADVGSLRSNRLYMVGKTVGDTNVLAFDAQGNQLADINIQVRIDEDTLRQTVRQFFPNEDIELHTVNDSIILKGEVSTPSVANQVRDLVGRFVKTQGQTLVDLMTVRGEQQVMLKVKVLEANRSVLREYGFETDYKPGTTGGMFNTNAGVGLTALTQFASGQLFWDDNGKFGPLKLALQGLERHGLINTLAEPTLTAISGETAGFLAGGEYPVPAGRDSQGNVSIEFKQFGVSLNFSPTVMASNRISLQLSTEVSEKSNADSVTLQNTIIPGLTVRRAQTTVQIGSGGTLMIAGLLKSNTVDSMNGFPGLKDMPIIGELFKSKSFQRGESELVILVTPYIVQPYAMANATRVSEPPSAHPSNIIETSAPALGGGASSPSAPEAAPVPAQKASFVPQGEERTAGQRLGSADDKRSMAPDNAAAHPWGERPRMAGSEPAPQPAVASVPVTPVAVEHIETAPASSVAAAQPKVTKVAQAEPVTKSAEKPAAVAPVVAATKIKPHADVKPVLAEKSALPAAASPTNPLSASFINGLKRVYGKKAVSGLGGAAAGGYIVD